MSKKVLIQDYRSNPPVGKIATDFNLLYRGSITFDSTACLGHLPNRDTLTQYDYIRTNPHTTQNGRCCTEVIARARQNKVPIYLMLTTQDRQDHHHERFQNMTLYPLADHTEEELLEIVRLANKETS
jgi:hypothetical protein